MPSSWYSDIGKLFVLGDWLFCPYWFDVQRSLIMFQACKIFLDDVSISSFDSSLLQAFNLFTTLLEQNTNHEKQSSSILYFQIRLYLFSTCGKLGTKVHLIIFQKIQPSTSQWSPRVPRIHFEDPRLWESSRLPKQTRYLLLSTIILHALLISII